MAVAGSGGSLALDAGDQAGAAERFIDYWMGAGRGADSTRAPAADRHIRDKRAQMGTRPVHRAQWGTRTREPFRPYSPSTPANVPETIESRSNEASRDASSSLLRIWIIQYNIDYG